MNIPQNPFREQAYAAGPVFPEILDYCPGRNGGAAGGFGLRRTTAADRCANYSAAPTHSYSCAYGGRHPDFAADSYPYAAAYAAANRATDDGRRIHPPPGHRALARRLAGL